MKRIHWGILGLVSALLVVLLLMLTNWQPGNRKPSADKPIRVVASLNFYGEVAREVAGSHGQVTSFINSSAIDPHEFQPTTKQAMQVAKANVVIENGLGYDYWMEKTAKANDNTKALINVGTQVAHKQDGDNEHVWYQPNTMGKLADLLAKKYSKLDPAHRRDYVRNARNYKKKLAKLNDKINAAKVEGNHQVDVSEPVFDYALTNLGYQINDTHFEKAVEDGTDPSPKDIKGIQDDIKNHRIDFFVNNTQESNSTVENLVKLAKKNGIPVLNVTESEPKGENYVSWMTKQYDELRKIQKLQQ